MATSDTTSPLTDTTTTIPIINDHNGSSVSSPQETNSQDGACQRLLEFYRDNPRPMNRISMEDPRRFHLGDPVMCPSIPMQSKDSTEDVAHPADDLHGNHLQLIEPNVPTEYPRDTDFSEDASSSSSDEQLQGQGNDHRHHANAPAIARTSSINQDELINSGNATIGIEMTNQPNPTVASQLPCAEANDEGSNVGTSTANVVPIVGHIAVQSNASMPKQPAIIDSVVQSAEQNAL